MAAVRVAIAARVACLSVAVAVGVMGRGVQFFWQREAHLRQPLAGDGVVLRLALDHYPAPLKALGNYTRRAASAKAVEDHVAGPRADQHQPRDHVQRLLAGVLAVAPLGA